MFHDALFSLRSLPTQNQPLSYRDKAQLRSRRRVASLRSVKRVWSGKEKNGTNAIQQNVFVLLTAWSAVLTRL